MEDVDRGFATEPMTMHDLHTYLEGARYRLIPRFVITQSFGRHRVIDDVHTGGQSDTSTDENALCSA
eukprot:9773988-Karenia_brevis.AAC.1